MSHTKKFQAYSAPATKDIPLRMRWNSWSSSWHPKGPKVEYRCQACGEPGSTSAADFPYRAQGDFRIRCARRGQMNYADITVS